MTRWEYLVQYLGEPETDLDACGTQGWELVTVVVQKSGAQVAYMKRKIRE